MVAECMTFKECIEVIECDLRSRKQPLAVATLVKDPIARFHLYLRLTEYLGRRGRSPLYYIVKWLFLRLSRLLGFSIPENTLGRGVYLPHYGTIVVNSKAVVGDYCVLNSGVVIGRHPVSKRDVPTLGVGVFVGPGAKVFGAISLASCSVIGANSVVTKDVSSQEFWAGAPATLKRSISESEYRNFISNSDAWPLWLEPSGRA